MLPFFYHKELDATQKQIVLNEETSKHCVQVLRMKVGELLQLTNGNGLLIEAKIVVAEKRNVIVQQTKNTLQYSQNKKISIAISLLKNASRFEWFLEKATEIGVAEIIPIISKRTEKQNFKFDRMNNIVVSAMLQSQQTFLPKLQEPTLLNDILQNEENISKTKLIAHCTEDERNDVKQYSSYNNTIILIGPEGDFTNEEIAFALEKNYLPVALGNTRLRTETAGIVAASILMI